MVAACALALIGCSGAAPRQVGATAGPQDAAPGQADTRPRFSDMVDELTARVGEDVRITLPPATGGNGSLRYTLFSAPPGLAFNAEARTLAGTPEKAGEYPMTYRVEDSDTNSDPSDAAELMFLLTVATAPGTGGDSPLAPDDVAARANLTAVSGDRVVTLSWQAPPVAADITGMSTATDRSGLPGHLDRHPRQRPRQSQPHRIHRGRADERHDLHVPGPGARFQRRERPFERSDRGARSRHLRSHAPGCGQDRRLPRPVWTSARRNQGLGVRGGHGRSSRRGTRTRSDPPPAAADGAQARRLCRG